MSHVDPEAPRLSAEEADGTYVVLMAFNEERVIRDVVQRVLALNVHVVVVDDASTDGTVSQLRGLPITDAHNGLRAFRAEVAPALRITQNRMAHASELLQKIREAGLAYAEIPAVVRYTEYSRAKGQTGLGAVDILYELLMARLLR